MEQLDFEPEESAETIHYLEWSLQVPINSLLGIFGQQSKGLLSKGWFGYSVFHRSTVFGLFGDRAGGINYPGFSLEFVLD